MYSVCEDGSLGTVHATEALYGRVKVAVFTETECVSAWKVVVAPTNALTSTVEKENVAQKALGIPCLVSTGNNAQRNKPLYYFPVVLVKSTHFEVNTLTVSAKYGRDCAYAFYSSDIRLSEASLLEPYHVTMKVNNRICHNITAKINYH